MISVLVCWLLARLIGCLVIWMVDWLVVVVVVVVVAVVVVVVTYGGVPFDSKTDSASLPAEYPASDTPAG